MSKSKRSTIVRELPKSPVLNPYAHAARQVRALLRLEMDYGPEERAKSSWMVQVDFLKRKLIIGKGGANTCFYVFGNGKRRICYPNVLLGILDKLVRQPYVVYRVEAGGKTTVRYSSEHATRTAPTTGARIIGVAADGVECLVYRAKRDLSGTLKWIRAR